MGIYTRSLGLFLILFLLVSPEGMAQKKKKSKKSKETQSLQLNTQLDSISYALGMGMAKNLMNSGVDSLGSDAFNAGLTAVFKGDSTLINEADIQVLLKNYFTGLAEKEGERNLAEGEAFLAENKLRPEITTTASGLQYEVINPGDGEKPTADDKVTVHYEGMLLDGTIFDSSYERQQEIQFGLSQVIPGWTEGLQLMSPGAKYILYIPSNLAYGERGAGADIPPNSTLIFTVELLSVDHVE
jgi:FKBP-type peptidyl-prolyl cis-trans isomerase FklB